MTFIEPLDLERILINNLAGSVEIFMFIAFIAIGAITTADFFPAIYLLTVVIAGMIAANAMTKIITRWLIITFHFKNIKIKYKIWALYNL